MVQETFEIETIPAIIPESLEDLREKLSRVAKLVKTVQIDVCDGEFTDSVSWPYLSRGNIDAEFKKVLSEEDGLPYWDSVDFEAHLMVANPLEDAERWIQAGAFRIIVHVESISAEDLAGLIKSMTDRFIEVGLAIDVDTPVDAIAPYAGEISIVQLMGIDEDGMQGEPFDEVVLAKVAEAKLKFPHLHIAVDGGVNLDTAPAIVDAGADRLIVGSAIFESYDIPETLREFRDLI